MDCKADDVFADKDIDKENICIQWDLTKQIHFQKNEYNQEY